MNQQKIRACYENISILGASHLRRGTNCAIRESSSTCHKCALYSLRSQFFFVTFPAVFFEITSSLGGMLVERRSSVDVCISSTSSQGRERRPARRMPRALAIRDPENSTRRGVGGACGPLQGSIGQIPAELLTGHQRRAPSIVCRETAMAQGPKLITDGRNTRSYQQHIILQITMWNNTDMYN